MSKKPVIVYGASGYTGRLICEALRNYEIPFVAAGRDKKRVEEAMRFVPGIETADYEVVGVAHDAGALARRVFAYNYGSHAPHVLASVTSKTFCTQMALEVTNEAIQLFGGNGLTKE